MDTIGIPEARKRIHDIGLAHNLPELIEIAARMQRRKPRYRRATARSRKVTPEVARQIRALKQDCPWKSNLEIAGNFDTNPGRVSEALHGLR